MRKSLLAVSALAALALGASQAEAHGFVGIGINLGVPVYRPYCGPYYRPYGYYYVAPAPVYVAPAPIVVQPAPIYTPVYTAPVATVPVTTAPVVSRSAAPDEPLPLPKTVTVAGDVNRLIQQLFDQEERVRSDAAMELGRMKSDRAVEPLITVLTSDRSPLARESAARALGLIGAPRSLTSLQQTAQADSDRDVRRSAQFSAEIIRTNLRRD
jgi:hypothetical protein